MTRNLEPVPRRFGWFHPKPEGLMDIIVQEHVLTSVEWDEFENYTKVVNDLRAFVIDFHALTADFELVSTIENQISAEITNSMSRTLIDLPRKIKAQAMAQRAVSNFLAAASAFKDRGVLRQSRRSNPVPAPTLLKARISEVYDASFGFRVMSVLRNHAQHFENPISFCPINAERDDTGTLNARLEMMLDPMVLVGNTKLNAKVRRELNSFGDLLPLMTILHEAMTGLRKVMYFVLDENRERLAAMAAYVTALYTAFQIPGDAIPVIFNGFEPSTGPPTNENCLFLGVEELVDYVQLLEQLNREFA